MNESRIIKNRILKIMLPYIENLLNYSYLKNLYILDTKIASLQTL